MAFSRLRRASDDSDMVPVLASAAPGLQRGRGGGRPAAAAAAACGEQAEAGWHWSGAMHCGAYASPVPAAGRAGALTGGRWRWGWFEGCSPAR